MLNKLYETYDEEFDIQESVRAQVNFGLGQVIDLHELHNTNLVSRSNIYPLVAAFVAVQFEDSPVRNGLEDDVRDRALAERGSIVSNLTTLSDAIENNVDEPPLNELVTAARQGTNTALNRTIRLGWLHEALTSAEM